MHPVDERRPASREVYDGWILRAEPHAWNISAETYPQVRVSNARGKMMRTVLTSSKLMTVRIANSLSANSLLFKLLRHFLPPSYELFGEMLLYNHILAKCQDWGIHHGAISPGVLKYVRVIKVDTADVFKQTKSRYLPGDSERSSQRRRVRSVGSEIDRQESPSLHVRRLHEPARLSVTSSTLNSI